MAEKVGLKQNTYLIAIKGTGMLNNSDRCLNSADKWSDLERLYKTKISMREIATHLHISQTSLYSKVKELGLKRKPRYKRKLINAKLFRELVKLGIPDISIAKKFNICVSTVLKRKKQWHLFSADEQNISKGKKGAACCTYYKETGERPECPATKNILENYKDDVIPLLESGVSKTEIAKKYGVCTSTVYNFIHLYDIDAPVKKICDNQEDLIVNAYKSGDSLEDISLKSGCAVNTIYLKIKSMGLSRKPQSVKWKSILNNQKDTIKELYYQGMSGTEMARRLDVSKDSIYACIRRMKFDANQRKVRNNSPFRKHDNEILEMRQNGMTLKQIAQSFGMAENTVLYRLRKITNTYNGFANVD